MSCHISVLELEEKDKGNGLSPRKKTLKTIQVIIFYSNTFITFPRIATMLLLQTTTAKIYVTQANEMLMLVN